MSLFRRTQHIDRASVLSEELYAQQRSLAKLRIAEANLENDGYAAEELRIVKQQITRLNLEFEINKHKLEIELKERELKALT